MRNKIILGLSLSMFALSANAQSDADALRVARPGIHGTARSMAMAGAFSALGADFSSLSTNPAGIGLYRRGEFLFSPELFYTKTSSSFLGNSSSDNRFGLGIGNLGLVGVIKPRRAEAHGWQAVNFGIGYNRLSSFNAKSAYSGMNPDNSYLDYILQRVNSEAGTDPAEMNPFFENLAYQTFLINPIDTVDTLHYASEIPNAGTLQRRNIKQKGSTGEVVFSFGANYKDKLYLGATIGVVVLNYTEISNYEERDEEDTIARFKSFNLNQETSTEGTGVNLKLGLIYRPYDWIRLGAAIHTPTIYSMSDNYSSKMTSTFDNGATYDNSAEGVYNYEYITPIKAIGSIAFVLGKQAVISGDYEIMNYNEMSFTSKSDAFFDVNSAIEAKYTTTSNIRAGLEWRYDNLSFRGGYALLGSPFKSSMHEPGADFSSTVYSGGIGIRDEKYFLDFSYSYGTSNEFYRPYKLRNEVVAGAKNKVVTHQFMTTFGVKF